LISRTQDKFNRETNLDDVMQISNVFMNVSKGEVAKSGDLQKAFGKTDVAEIVKEVRNISSSMRTDALIQISAFRFLRRAKCK
jgi:hypothetical protein